MAPIVGARPLVTFTSESGRVVRVHGAKSNRNGISAATVSFPDHGPWTGTMKVPGETLAESGGDFGRFEIGAADSTPAGKVVETVKPPAQDGPSSRGDSGVWPGWILLGGAALLGGLAFTAMRMGVPARLRTRLGGGGA
jgi:hypothetical protein